MAADMILGRVARSGRIDGLCKSGQPLGRRRYAA